MFTQNGLNVRKKVKQLKVKNCFYLSDSPRNQGITLMHLLVCIFVNNLLNYVFESIERITI